MQNTEQCSKKIFLFVPLFNIKVEKDILNKDIYGYKLITSQQYFASYYNCKWPSLSQTFNEIVASPRLGQVSLSPTSRYILVKEIHFDKSIPENTVSKLYEQIIPRYVQKIIFFLMSCRCIESGNIQYNRYFVFSEEYSSVGYLPNSTPPECLTEKFYKIRGKYITFSEYEFNDSIVEKAINFAKKISKVRKLIEIPLSFFMEYYASDKIYAKLLRLAIVLETTILNDCKNELKYRLQVRTSALLHRDISKILALVYDIRSDIVHSGDIQKDEIKKLKKLIEHDDTDEVLSLIFIFVRDYLDNIIREVLYIFIYKIYKTRKTLEQTAKEIDDVVFSVLEKNEG